MRGAATQPTTRLWLTLTACPGARHAVGGVDAAGPVRGHEVLVVEVVVAAVHQHARSLRRLSVLVTEGRGGGMCHYFSGVVCVTLHNISFSIMNSSQIGILFVIFRKDETKTDVL